MAFRTIIAGGGAAGTGVAIGALMLPRQVHRERRAHVVAAPAPNGGPNGGLNGGLNGVGAGFRFDGKDGDGTWTVAAMAEGSVRHTIDPHAMGALVQTVAAAPAQGGARALRSMGADLGSNPAMRIFGLFMDRLIGKIFQRGLVNLAAAT